MASSAIRPQASAQSEGTNRTLDSQNITRISSTGLRRRTLGRDSKATRSSAVVPQVGTAANSTSVNMSARARNTEIPLSAQGLIIVTNEPSICLLLIQLIEPIRSIGTCN